VRFDRNGERLERLKFCYVKNGRHSSRLI
jgi:hypothetical protein